VDDAGADALDATDADVDAMDADVCDGVACPPGQSCCGGVCTDTTRDQKNCGSCGKVCPADNVCEYVCVPCPASYVGKATYTDSNNGSTVESTITWLLSDQTAVAQAVPNACVYVPTGTATLMLVDHTCSLMPNSVQIAAASSAGTLVIAPPSGPFAGAYQIYGQQADLWWSGIECCNGQCGSAPRTVGAGYLPKIQGSLGTNGTVVSSGADAINMGATYSLSFTPQ
jgi:hypothetical protein